MWVLYFTPRPLYSRGRTPPPLYTSERRLGGPHQYVIQIHLSISSFANISICSRDYFRDFENSLTHAAEPFLRSCLFCSHSTTSQGFMEPKFHYSVQKSPPLVPILSQIDQIHTILSYFSKIHFNIIHPPTSWSSQWFLSFWIFHQYPTCIPLFPNSCNMPCDSENTIYYSSNCVAVIKAKFVSTRLTVNKLNPFIWVLSNSICSICMNFSRLTHSKWLLNQYSLCTEIKLQLRLLTVDTLQLNLSW
jgi:hypothetical protein